MDKITEVWVDSGSGPGHMQAVHLKAIELNVQQWYRAFISHVAQCATCRGEGIDCAEAVKLRQAWRAAHRAARGDA